MQDIQVWLSPVTRILGRIEKVDPAVIEHFRKSLDENFGLVIASTRRVHLHLSNRNWYLIASENYLTAADMIHLALLTETDVPDKIDDFMSQWVESKLPAVKEMLAQGYPERKKLLDKAFQAHDSGDYDLSIPVFLAQADGIWHDLSGKSGYEKKERKRYIEKERSARNIPERLSYLFAPLRSNTPLCKHYSKGRADTLNRHGIFHGLITDYGTKINSLKAISWLLYIGTFEECLDEMVFNTPVSDETVDSD
jgi:hypothetical protein